MTFNIGIVERQEYYTNRSEYFFIYISGFFNATFFVESSTYFIDSASIIMKLWNKIVNIIIHPWLTFQNIVSSYFFKILEEELKIKNYSKFVMEVTVRKRSRKYKPAELSWLLIASVAWRFLSKLIAIRKRGGHDNKPHLLTAKHEQETAIRNFPRGRDVMAVSPTGVRKSMMFTLFFCLR